MRTKIDEKAQDVPKKEKHGESILHLWNTSQTESGHDRINANKTPPPPIKFYKDKSDINPDSDLFLGFMQSKEGNMKFHVINH